MNEMRSETSMSDYKEKLSKIIFMAKQIALEYGEKRQEKWLAYESYLGYIYKDENILITYSAKLVSVVLLGNSQIRSQPKPVLSLYNNGFTTFDCGTFNEAILYMTMILSGVATQHNDFFYITNEK
jgi:hypothetical protein